MLEVIARVHFAKRHVIVRVPEACFGHCIARVPGHALQLLLNLQQKVSAREPPQGGVRSPARRGELARQLPLSLEGQMQW